MIKLYNKRCSFNCIVTEFYDSLFKEFIVPSFINSKISLNIIRDPNVYGQGFGEPEFIKIMSLKIEKIIESLKIKIDDFIVWMDVDLFFLETPEKIMLDLQNQLEHYDILISSDWNNGYNINSGFFAVVPNKKTIKFFEHVFSEIQEKKSTEQPVILKYLYKNIVNFKILPITYWNLTIGFPIPKNAKVLHANWVTDSTTLGKLEGNTYVEKKIFAMRKLKMFAPPSSPPKPKAKLYKYL